MSADGHVGCTTALMLFHGAMLCVGLHTCIKLLSLMISGVVCDAAAAHACRYLEFLRAASPALALVHAEKQHIPVRQQDASCVCRLMCRISASVFPGVPLLRARLLGGAARRREGPVAAAAAVAECMRAAADSCDRRHGAPF